MRPRAPDGPVAFLFFWTGPPRGGPVFVIRFRHQEEVYTMSLLQEDRTHRKAPAPAPGERLEPAEAEEAVLIRETADLAAEDGHRFGRREVRVTRREVSVHDPSGARLLS